jgi:hypothetical protein
MERNNYKYGNITGFDFELMQEFLKLHVRIFFYGHGVWGHNLADYFEYRGWHFDGYIVSEKGSSDVGDNVYCFNEIDIESNDGIIIAQKNKRTCESILDYISGSVSMNNVLTPVYR